MIKSLIIFVGGLVIGAFGYEALMKDVHQQKIVGILTEVELNQVEKFLKIKNVDEKTRYCLSYNSARYNVHVLNQKIKAAETGKAKNGLLLSNIENVKKLIEAFTLLEKQGLEYACENT
jgi:hypothetical protein